MLANVLGLRSNPDVKAASADVRPPATAPASDPGASAKAGGTTAGQASHDRVAFLGAGSTAVAAPGEAAGKRLVVGPGISLSGEITACDRLVVQGSVQVTLNETRAIEIAESGRFTNGKAEVEEAEISGVYEGDLTVRNRLLIRSTGRVQGNVRYGEIEVERGGRVTGSVSMIDAKQGGKAAEIRAAQPDMLKKSAA